MGQLWSENQLLREQINRTSTNSSQPPSQEPPKGFKTSPKRQSGKKRGGQPGHEGHERPLYPIEQCDSVTDYYPLVTCFQVVLSRSQAAAQAILGQYCNGTVISDRHGGYNWLALSQRQVCWAHLKRDFTQIAERAIRPVVLWQRTSFGSQNQASSIFVARMLTVVTKSVFHLLRNP